MAVTIKEAIAILNDNHWPGEKEADIPSPASAHIQKLRDRCAQEIRLALINLQHIDGTVNTKTSDRHRLAATVRRLIEINKIVSNIDCILYSDTLPPQSDTQ